MRLICVLLCCSFTAFGYAATLNKCDDGQGHLTFTQQACPDGSGGQQIKVVPATEGMVIGPRGEDAAEEQASQTSTEGSGVSAPASSMAAQTGSSTKGYTVVGADPASSCGPFTEKDVRAAQVRKQVLSGMQAADVEGAWGSPSRKDARQWIYQIDDCLAWFVELDGNGCVTGTRKGDSPVGLRCDDLMFKQRLERERQQGGASHRP